MRESALDALEEAPDADLVPDSPLAQQAAADLSTPAGLAKVDSELNAAFELAADMKVTELRRSLGSPVFVSFLGVAPEGPSVERQLQLLATFPAKARREAARTLGQLIIKLGTLNASLAAAEAAEPSSTTGASALTAETLNTAITDIRDLSQRFTALCLADGCKVCPDQIRSSNEDDLFVKNPNLRKLKEFEPRLLRRPDERNEEVARALGFREGELIGGY